MPVIPRSLLVPCSMQRIICHWSEGNYEANSTDREAYNLLVEGDGKVIGGDHPISDNVSTADHDYAAHTRGANSGSIGIACCAMAGCKESPFKPGAKPMKKLQWDTMVQAVAELCHFYRIPVKPTTVLGHGEVQANLGIQQRGKWDPMVWPWDTSKTRAQVGVALRSGVAEALARITGGTPPAPPSPPPPTPGRDVYVLRASLLANDPEMRRIAATDAVLVPPLTSQRIPGIATVQEALNRLALTNAAIPRIDLGSADKFRGFFGKQTVAAIRAFQAFAGIDVDGAVGDDTLKALDAALNGGVVPGPTPGPAPAGTYQPPVASRDLLKTVRFDKASVVGSNFVAKFKRADAGHAKTDPSRCAQLLKFGDGTLFFEAKMALCVDGSPRAKALDPDGLTGTAHSIKGKPINAEHISYVVLPMPDRRAGDAFHTDLGFKKGDLAMVVCKGQRCGAIFGELGPVDKIGETSIKVHEKLHALGAVPNPWKNSAKTAIKNVSVDREVLYFVFPGTASTIASKLTPATAEKLIQDEAESQWQKFLARAV